MKSINRVLLPQPIEAQAVGLLEREICKVVIAADPKPETVKALIKGVHGVILRTGIAFTRELIAHADALMAYPAPAEGWIMMYLTARCPQISQTRKYWKPIAGCI